MYPQIRTNMIHIILIVVLLVVLFALSVFKVVENTKEINMAMQQNELNKLKLEELNLKLETTLRELDEAQIIIKHFEESYDQDFLEWIDKNKDFVNELIRTQSP